VRESTIGGSSERFGYEWDTYASIFPEYEEQFRRWLPFFSPDDWRGKRFIDVGCGMGRNSFWPMKYGATGGVAVDIDERSLAGPSRQLLFSRLPISWVHMISIIPAAILWVMLRIGLNQIAYFRLLRTFSFEHVRSIVFDQMLPRIANYWTKSEVELLMRDAGLKDVELVMVNEMSWAARGIK